MTAYGFTVVFLALLMFALTLKSIGTLSERKREAYSFWALVCGVVNLIIIWRCG